MANEIAVAQDQSPTATDDKLIKDRPEDLLLVKIHRLQEKNLTAQQVEELAEVNRKFIWCYYSLAYRHYGLSRNQIKDLGQNEQIALANLLFKNAKPMATFQLAMIPILICIPIVGWFVLGAMFVVSYNYHATASFYYRKYFQKLQQALGKENWFPALNC